MYFRSTEFGLYLCTMSVLNFSVENRIAWIVMSRPEKRNALSVELIDGMTEAFSLANAREDVRVIVLKSSDKPFCAGADLQYLTQLRNNSLEENEADSQRLRRMFDAMYHSPKLVITQVEGPALAGGCGLATLSDLCFATPEASFGYTEVKIGFIPALVMVYLAEKIGGGAIRDLLLTGRVLDATEAKEMGLVQRIVNSEEIDEAVGAVARGCAEGTSGAAVSTVKEMLRQIPSMHRDQALDYAARMNAHARATPDCIKGIDAFLNKQKLTW